MSELRFLGVPELSVFLAEDAINLRRHLVLRMSRQLQKQMDVDDLMQETWSSAFRSIGSARIADRESLHRWVYTIANRRLIDALRQLRALRNGYGLIVEFATDETSVMMLNRRLKSKARTPSSISSRNEALGVMRNALGTLSHDRQHAIWLRYIDRKSYAEIARELDKSIPAVRSLVYQGVRQLRGIMGSASCYLTGGDSKEKSRSA